MGHIRKLAKEYGIHVEYVESIKQCFDSYDLDNSGYVDIDEFKEILYKALRVPKQLELPPSRIQYFWSEINGSGSGKAGFGDFLVWWLRYFGDDATSLKSKYTASLPFEDFYKQVRRIGSQHLDPLVYPPGGDDDEAV